MRCSFSLHVPKALPSLPSSSLGTTSLFFASKHKRSYHKNTVTCNTHKADNGVTLNYTNLALHIGALLALHPQIAFLVEEPVLAVTGENNRPELSWVLTQLGIALFVYFLVVPPVIMLWLWKRWYRRGLLEMYFQFMFVFIFFPGVILWAPFLNFRKFPRDPSMQYPWSVPEDPSKIRSSYSKYPYAEPEDYDNL